MRKCHLNTCPVGIATQDPVLRAKFQGKPEHVIRFMFYVAEEAREWMAKLGFRSLREMVGHSECLQARKDVAHWKASRLDFSDVLMRAEAAEGVGVCKLIEQDHGLDKALDNQLLELCAPALERREAVRLQMPIRNVHRTVGGMLAGEVARRQGKDGLPEGTIQIDFQGSAGQSFGAFLMPGIEFSLEGDANDYAGKGLAGGVIAIRPPKGVSFRSDENILIGNTAFYGATSGKAFFNGRAGERFGVRNSGGIAVVEGVGDHGCEYMTGGRVVVLGRTGRNFAAGMSGGYAYVLDEHDDVRTRCNLGMVELEALNHEDAAFVASLLEEHIRRTGSPKAKQLMSQWENTLTRLIKVVPVEYRRVLDDLARREKAASQSQAMLHGSP
jgi:glutamate synthase domain-containing protein 3